MIDFGAYRSYLAPAQTAITRWYREGASCREIAEELVRVGVAPPHNAINKREAVTASVRHMLTGLGAWRRTIELVRSLCPERIAAIDANQIVHGVIVP